VAVAIGQQQTQFCVTSKGVLCGFQGSFSGRGLCVV